MDYNLRVTPKVACDLFYAPIRALHAAAMGRPPARTMYYFIAISLCPRPRYTHPALITLFHFRKETTTTPSQALHKFPLFAESETP